MTTDNLVHTGSDFARLSHRVSAAGLMQRRPGYYTARIAVVTGLFAAGWVAFAFLGNSWWQLAVAAFLAVMFGQIALLSHDLAHKQVFRRRRPTEIAGMLAGNLGIGMSYGWWMDKHTRHHANPNHEELDPDVDPDILVWSKDQARASRGVPRFIGRYQAFLFFPLLTLEGLNLHWSGIRAVRKPGLRRRGLEAALLAAHFVLYSSALLTVLSPGMALLFFAVHQGLWGVYMGSIFAPNHKGMPTLTGRPGARLPPQAGADVPQRPRRPGDRRRPRRPQLPDRAPPVPQHAVAAPAAGAADRPGVLRRAGCPVRGDEPGRLLPAGPHPPA